MERVCFLLKVRKEKIAEYKQRHAEVWPEMLSALTATGWRNYSIFLREDGGLQPAPGQELLAQTFRVITLELPENRHSASIEDIARNVNAAVTALGVERYSVVGASFASTVALWMAILRPESVEAIVVSAPATPPRDESFEKRASELASAGLVTLQQDFATATPALMAREAEFRDRLQQAFALTKPTFNEDMRHGHTNM